MYLCINVYFYIKSSSGYHPLYSDLHLYFIDTYAEAREKVKEAIVTSNLESDQEEEMSRRKVVAPAWYQDSGKTARLHHSTPK